MSKDELEAMRRSYQRELDWTRRAPPDTDAAQRMNYVGGRGQSFAGPVGMISGPAGPPPSVPRESPASEAPFARLIFPPRIEKLPTSADFHVQDYQMAVPAGVGATVTSVNLRFQLPQSMVGFLQQTSIYVLGSLATTRLSFTVRINEGPVSGFTGIQNPPGAANLVLIFTNDIRVRIPNNAVVDIIITNLDGAAITAGGDLAGWYHPLADELRMYGTEGVS